MSDRVLAFAEIAQQVPTAWSVGFALVAFLAVTTFLCWLSQRRGESGRW